MTHKVRKNENFKVEKSILWIFFSKWEVFTESYWGSVQKGIFSTYAKKSFKSIRSPFFCNYCKTKTGFQEKHV